MNNDIQELSSNRWTGAAVAHFASSLVRRCLNEFAPPRQLNRWASIDLILFRLMIANEEVTIIPWILFRSIGRH